MFDLPVVTKRERKAATNFRTFLLDQGFQMEQYSVYLRFCINQEQATLYSGRIEKALPATEGSIKTLCFTDKQFERMNTFYGKSKPRKGKNPSQFQLF